MSNGSGGYTYGSLQNLIGKVTGTNQVTIELAKDVTLSSPISVSGNKNIVIEGKDHMISFAYASADTAFEVAASSKGTSLTVNNVHFVQTEGISQGHAICVREVTENVNVAAGGCTFENLYSGIYYGHVEKGERFPVHHRQHL